MKRLFVLFFACALFIAGCGRELVVETERDEQRAGATYYGKTILFPFAGEAAFTVVFRDLSTGNIVNATDGTSTATTAWDDGEITATQHSYSNDWQVAIPTTSVKLLYGTIYHVAAASVSKTTTPNDSPFLLDTKTGDTFGDTNPLENGYLRTIQSLYAD